MALEECIQLDNIPVMGIGNVNNVLYDAIKIQYNLPITRGRRGCDRMV